MMNQTLKIVSIGGFGHSGEVFDDIRDMERATLVGYAPAMAGESLAMVEDHPIFEDGPTRFADYRQMMTELTPDVAVIGTRLDKISEAMIAAAEAGVHVICEKPLALDENSLGTLYRVVRERGVKLTAMLTMRTLPAFRAAQAVYERGEIGEVVLANARKSYKWGTRPEWFARRETFGGTIGWIGIHALDMINFVTGMEFTSVAAMAGNFAHPSHSDCEDNVALILGLSNGGHATVSIDFLRPISAATHGDDWCRIVGTKGVIEANASQNWCRVITEADDLREVQLEKSSKMFESFLLSLGGESEHEIPPSVPFMLTDTCLRARESADTGRVLTLEPACWRDM